MLDRFRRHLETSQLIPSGAKGVVGWSGGADSTALLLLLREAGYDLVAAHLDHGQRAESAVEAEALGRQADAWGIPFAKGRADVPAIAAARRIGLEEAGREARYAFLESVRAATDSDYVATGHTLSDQAETVLFRVARGTGLKGLGGIPARRERIVRPLLPFSREETVAFCATVGFQPLQDPANESPSFARGKIRHGVMTILREINPDAEAAISRLAALAEEEDRFLDGAAAAALERAERPRHPLLGFVAEGVELELDRTMLGHLPPVLFRRAIRLAAGALGGTLDAAQVALLERAWQSGEVGSVTAEGGQVVLEFDAEVLAIRDLAAPVPSRYPLAPGETASEEFGWSFDYAVGPPTGTPPTRSALKVELDLREVKGGLHIRAPAPGDRLAPYGFAGHRKVSELLAEAGLSVGVRRRLPVVCDMVGPLWIPGVALGGRAAKSSTTERVGHLRFRPLTSFAGGSAERVT